MKSKNLIIELAMPVIFILISIATMVESQSMDSEGVFPTMAAGVLLLSAIYILVEILVKKARVVHLEGLHLGKVLITFLILVAYVIALKYAGYIVSTFVLCAFTIQALGYKNIPKTVLCSALAVAATFIVFKILLSVPLPLIFLDF